MFRHQVCMKQSKVRSLFSLCFCRAIAATSSLPISLSASDKISTAPSFLSFCCLFQYSRILYVTSTIPRPLEMASKPRPVMVLSGRSKWTANVRPSGTNRDMVIKLFPESIFDSFSTVNENICVTTEWSHLPQRTLKTYTDVRACSMW